MFKWHLEEYTSTSNIHAIFYQAFDNGFTNLSQTRMIYF